MLIGCIVDLRGSLARDDRDVVRRLNEACEDINLPGPGRGSAMLWQELGESTQDSAVMQATTANMLCFECRCGNPVSSPATRPIRNSAMGC